MVALAKTRTRLKRNIKKLEEQECHAAHLLKPFVLCHHPALSLYFPVICIHSIMEKYAENINMPIT